MPDRLLRWIFILICVICCFTIANWLCHAFDVEDNRERLKAIEASITNIEAILDPSSTEVRGIK